MAKIVAVTACPTGIAHTFMAAEALKKTASVMGHRIIVETQGSVGTKDPLTEAAIAEADVVILGADTHVEMTRFAEKPVYETTTSETIKNTEAVIDAALALVGLEGGVPKPGTGPVLVEETAAAGPKHIVAITACPTGIAHTFMAADALKKPPRPWGMTLR